jgi:TusA-related sulfurtransferase
MIIPVTFLKITQTLREIEKGETVEIVGSDPETRKDLFKILKAFPYELLNIHDEGDLYRIRLRKGNPTKGITV